MPFLPFSEDFDEAGLSGALPSGFGAGGLGGSTVTAENGVTPTSGTQMAKIICGSGTEGWITYGTADGSGGNIVLQCDVNAFSGTQPGQVGIAARGSTNNLDTSTSSYVAYYNFQSGTAGIDLWNSSSDSVLASRTSTGGAISGTKTLVFTPNGNALSLAVFDKGTSKWLNSSGAWQSGAATAVTCTDGTLSGSGFFGCYALTPIHSQFAYFDTLSVTALTSPAAAILSATESSDSPSISGYSEHAAIVATEAHDTGTLASQFTASGSGGIVEGHDTGTFAGDQIRGTLATTESHDTGSLSASAETAILTRQEGGDFAAIAGAFAGGATSAPTEGGDAAAFHGYMPAAVLIGIDGHDTGTFATTFASRSAGSPTERHDAATIAASVRNSVTLGTTEGHDTGAFAGSMATAGRASITEGRDLGVLSATTHVISSLATQEGGDRGAIVSVAEGIPPSFRVRESGDVATFLGGSPTLRYNVYASPAVNEPIDYSAPIGITAGLNWTTGTLSVPGYWSFGVRAANGNGEEQNLDCAVTILFDATGRDISNIPAPPVGLRAFPTAAAKIKVEWAQTIVRGPRAPTGFHVYMTAGSILSYTSPIATIAANTAIQGAYQTTLAGVDATSYTIGVRAFNASGEEANVNTVGVTADGTGPSPVTGLTLTTLP